MVYNWRIPIRISCPLCRQPMRRGQPLCRHCADRLPRNHHPCRRCALPLPASASGLCADCQRSPPAFELAVVPFLYQPPLDWLVRQFKAHDRLWAGRLAAGLLQQELARHSAPRPEALIPVPQHPARSRQRGYSQSQLLARWLGHGLQLPMAADQAHRVRQTPPQQGLSRKQRRANLRGAFVAAARPGYRHVALVDDVLTTGSTVQQLARTLRQAGVERVDVWAVARTPRPG